MPDLKSFQESVKKGDLEAIKAAVRNDPALVTARNEAGQSSFLLAKYYRQEQIASYLRDVLPGLDFFEACVAGETSDVERALANDTSLLESHNSDGWTPLHLASFFGHPDLIEFLLSAGAKINSLSTNAMRNTPLHAAAAGGQAKVVQLLLKRGADSNARQEGGWTALHAAALSGNREMVEALLAHGADLHARASNNQTALDLALQKGHGSIAALLEELGAKLG
jgi:uncharacterized protein